MNSSLPKMLEVFGKQTEEIVPQGRWSIDFSNDTVAGETISSVTVTVSRGDGVEATADDLTATMPSVAGVKVTCGFSKGVSGVDYEVKFVAHSSAGAVYVADFEVKVREAAWE